jgi:hypothetical protein
MTNYEFDEKNGIIRDKLTGERVYYSLPKGIGKCFQRALADFQGRD